MPVWSLWYLDCNSWFQPVCLRHAVNLFYFMWLLLRTKYSFNMITQTIWIDMYSKIELYVCLMQIFRLHDSNDIINSCWHSSHQNLYRYIVQRQRISSQVQLLTIYICIAIPQQNVDGGTSCIFDLYKEQGESHSLWKAHNAGNKLPFHIYQNWHVSKYNNKIRCPY